MTYRITGLDPHPFKHFAAMSDAQLAAQGARRVVATGPGFPCRVSLEDAPVGESLLLLHHVSHDVATPYRSAYAIYVREEAQVAADFIDTTPPVFAGRVLALRAFSADGLLQTAALAQRGEGDAKIRALLADAAIAYIDVHNAAYGCFAARVTRNG